MWLWIATFFQREDSPQSIDQSLLVRAWTLRECVRVAETHAALIAMDGDPHACIVVDLAQEAPGAEPAVLFAPLGAWAGFEEHARPGQVYWRRDRPSEPWTNYAAIAAGWPVEDMVYDPARHDRPAPQGTGVLRAT